MKRRQLNLFMAAVAATAAIFASGCSPEAQTPAAPPIDRSQALAVLAAEGKGFTVGTLMAAQTAYVLFDPQCPHCAALWASAQPLLRQTRFVWLPVALLNAKSLPQGAAIMTAANPVEAMTAHEKSLMAGQGGTSASASDSGRDRAPSRPTPRCSTGWAPSRCPPSWAATPARAPRWCRPDRCPPRRWRIFSV